MPQLHLSPGVVRIPGFTLLWAGATLQGEVAAQTGPQDVTARLALDAPSLRALLATAQIKPPPMRDAATLGALQVKTSLHLAAGAISLDGLSIHLDDTLVTGSIQVPALQPLSLRFTLAADRVNLDRYREPADLQGSPLELPLAWLRQLDAQGTLRIREAVVAGAAAREVRIDVE